MATRALVGFIDDRGGQPVLISTYNHYDGYPESLGAALDKHYSMPEEALKIASMGYISYIDAETGEIEAKHKEPADKTPLGNDFEEAMYKVAQKADSYGADYVYIYNVETDEWINVKMYGVTQTAEALAHSLQDYDGGIFPEPTKNLPAAPDQFDNSEANTYAEFSKMNEGEVGKVLSQVAFKLQDQPKHMVKAYMDSVANDIRLNGEKTYADYSVEDFEEDYDNYIADKMAMEQYNKDRWQYRAGIKK